MSRKGRDGGGKEQMEEEQQQENCKQKELLDPY